MVTLGVVSWFDFTRHCCRPDRDGGLCSSWWPTTQQTCWVFTGISPPCARRARQCLLSGSVQSPRCRSFARSCTGGRPSPSPAATPAPWKTANARCETCAVSVRRSWTCSHPRRTPRSSALSTTPSATAGIYYWKAANLAGLSDDAIAVIADHAYAAGSARSYVAMFHMRRRRCPSSAGCHCLRRPRRSPQHHHRRRVAA